MTAPIPTPRALKMHAKAHPEHKYRRAASRAYGRACQRARGYGWGNDLLRPFHFTNLTTGANL